MKHTPTPWDFMDDAVFKKSGFMEAAPGITIASPSNTEPICRVYGYLLPLEANAAFIVRACNSFDKFIVVLNNVLDEPFSPNLESEIETLLSEVGEERVP